ncbi:MAG: hypothetical protein BWX54_02358 [Verrucomicrobia bacterium ADurb.Bin018]|nr:MAG: hypothetical protein BWX54_02358 [Verrucomicrobia bacterium ADurb.Bin018]
MIYSPEELNISLVCAPTPVPSPTGTRYSIPCVPMSRTPTASAITSPGSTGYIARVTAIGYVEASLSRPSYSIVTLLRVTSITAESSITDPAINTSSGKPGGYPLLGSPSPQICVESCVGDVRSASYPSSQWS